MQYTFDSLHNKGKQIVITSDRPPKEMPELTAALCSRFEMGLMVEMVKPDDLTRLNIIKKLAEDNGIKYEEAALKYIAKNFTNNVRELEGAFNKVCAYAEMNGQCLSLKLAQSVLKCDNSEEELSSEKIAEVAAQYFNVSVDELKSPARAKNISNARHLAIYLTRELTGKSFVSIAEFYNKKHSTIVYAYETVKKELFANKNLSDASREIKQALKLI